MKQLALMLGMVALLGCGGDDASPRSDGGKGETGDKPPTGRQDDAKLTRQAEDKMIECGLQDDRDDSGEGVEDDYDRCAVRCVIEADCDDLSNALCGRMASANLEACVKKCNLAPSDGFACEEGKKIAHVRVCDGVPDCAGKEDESDCDPICEDASTPDEDVSKCDGVRDCRDGSDEEDCPICE